MPTSGRTRPRLIVVYGHRSLPIWQLSGAAADLCDVIWLVDAQDESAAAVRPLLERRGTVVEALGLPAAEAAAALAPLQPNGITTFYDHRLDHISAIAGELGLPFNGPDTALALADKYAQREALRAAGVPTPAVVRVSAGGGATATAEAELVELAGRVEYPAVLKPCRASGSWHTFRLDRPEDLLRRMRSLADGPAEELIVESYLSDGDRMPVGFEADYVSVESIVADGRILHLTTTGRFPTAEPFREAGLFLPSTLAGDSRDAVLETATAALRAIDFRWGCAHTEIKLTAEGPRVIEINGRIGGGIADMLKLACGCDLIAMAMATALGIDHGVAGDLAADGVAYRFFYQPPAGRHRVVQLEGLDNLSATAGVDDVTMHHQPGAVVDSDDGSRAYLFSVIGLAPDIDGLLAIDRFLSDEIDATYEPAE